MRVLRQVDKHASGDRDLRGKSRALGPDRILHHLHDDRLAFGEDLLDWLDLGRAAFLGSVLPDIGDVQEGRALQPYLDKCRLHAGQHPGDAAFIDVAHAPPAGGPFHEQLLRHAVLHHRHPRFLGRDVDEDFLVHGRGGRG
jgi:hypothetical protein